MDTRLATGRKSRDADRGLHDDDDDELGLDPPPRRPASSLGRKIWNFLLTLVILGLAGGVGYLLSERNARTYYLVQEGKALVVHRGRFMPTGHEPLRPESPKVAEQYAKLALPAHISVVASRQFLERAELDEALAEQLLDWTRDLLERDRGAAASLGVRYLERVRLLPGTTGAQLETLERLEREVAYYEARGAIDQAVEALRKAEDRLRKAASAGGPNVGPSRIALPEIERESQRLRSLVDRLDGAADVGQPALVAPPVPAEPEDEPEPEPEPEPVVPEPAPEVVAPVPTPKPLPRVKTATRA
jgi:hypothetical protein